MTLSQGEGYTGAEREGLSGMNDSIVTPALIGAIRSQYPLDWRGIHGQGHWERVRRVGLALAAKTGADVRVVELFAFLHDSCRLNDGRDPEHGPRAVKFAASLRGAFFDLEDDKFELLCQAMAGHTEGRLDARADVGTCWDADRFDLGRVSISPEPRFFSMPAAREAAFFSWAARGGAP